MAKLINGNGNPAIYAAEDADLIASLAGNVTCIANVGNKYAATEEDATTIRLDDGVIITKEGRRIQLEAGESDTFYIPTGTSGVTNYYIIGYKLVQNADSTQVAEQFVQKMNSSSETITEDTFRSGATEVYVSLYRVTQVDFTITSITGLLPELLDSNSAKDDIAQLNNDINNISFDEHDLATHFTVTSQGTWIYGSNPVELDPTDLVQLRLCSNSAQGKGGFSTIVSASQLGATNFPVILTGGHSDADSIYVAYTSAHTFGVFIGTNISSSWNYFMANLIRLTH